MLRIKKYILLYGVTALYMGGAFAFKEFHPFSHFPMYNQLPNWSYVFYFTDKNDSLIPCKKLNFTGGSLGHLYYNIAADQKIKYGNGMESEKELKIIGAKMLEEVMKQKPDSNKIDTIKLMRKHFFYIGNKINTEDKLMFCKKYD
jgi:hypothetical protein